MKENAPELLTYIYGVAGMLYLMNLTWNPAAYIVLIFSVWMIYRLLKREELRENTNRR